MSLASKRRLVCVISLRRELFARGSQILLEGGGKLFGRGRHELVHVGNVLIGQSTSGLTQCQGVQQVGVTGAGVVTAGAEHVTQCSQHVHSGARAYFKARLGGFGGGFGGSQRALVSLDLADAGLHGQEGVARLLLSGAILKFVLLLRLLETVLCFTDFGRDGSARVEGHTDLYADTGSVGLRIQQRIAFGITAGLFGN